MKKLWWIATTFWVAIFAVGTAFVWLRKVDGAGATQTLEAKLASFIVLLIAFIFPVIIQVVWLIVNLVINSNKKTKI